MDIFHIDEHVSYNNDVGDIKCGFKLVSISQDKTFTSLGAENNSILFIISGKIELSCNEFLHRQFGPDSIIFLPRLSDIFGRMITKCKFIVLIFDNHITNLCDNYTLNQYIERREQINYDFRGLTSRSLLKEYLQLQESYLIHGLNGIDMREVKLKEFFVILRMIYSKEEIAEFFYPVLGKDLEFRLEVSGKYKIGYNIKEFSEILSMHEKYFPKKFKKEFGISFHQWTLKQKAEHIKYKLTFSQSTIKEIVNEFEFANYAHFNRFCKKHFGCIPRELVRQLRPEKITK